MLRLGNTCRATIGLAAAVATLSSSAFAQGDNGFLRGAGRTDAAITYAFDSYDHFWVGDNKVEDPGVGEITRESLNLWVAHGLREDLDLVGSFSLVEVENDGTAPFRDERQLQDMVLGVKWRAFEQRVGPGAFSLLAAPSVKIPMSHYQANAVTAIGDGQIDYRARAIAHYRFDFGAFISLESGFDYRTEQPGNEIPVNLTVGIPVTQYVTLMPFYSTVTSDGDIDIGQGDFPAVEEESERVGVSIYARLNETIGLSAGWKTTIDGRNTGEVDGYWAGLVFRIGS